MGQVKGGEKGRDREVRQAQREERKGGEKG